MNPQDSQSELDKIMKEHSSRTMTYSELYRREHHDPNRLGADLLHADEVAKQAIEAYVTTRVKEAEQELLFDLDEIDNKPWRVFRQLANIMPEYADTYIQYEAFYSYGGGRKVRELIDEFMDTEDYKESEFPEKIASFTTTPNSKGDK